MAASQVSMAQANLAARAQVLAQSVDVIQNVTQGTGTYNPANTPTVVLEPKKTGLTMGFYIDVAATFTNFAATAPGDLYITEQGIANIFDSITLTDFNGITRINDVSGFALSMLNFLRFRSPIGSLNQKTSNATANTTNSVSDFSSKYNTVNVPQVITGSTVSNPQTAYFTLYLPLAYSPTDLRGAIYTNTSDAAMNISLHFNTNIFSTVTATAPYVTTGAPGAVYANAVLANVAMTSVTITARQDYLSNLPAWTSAYPTQFNQYGILVPGGDLSVLYQYTKSLATQTLAAGETTEIPYAPQRSYLTSLLVYNNGNQLNNGTDINTIGISGANQFPFLQADPKFLSQQVELNYGVDLPSGTYLIDRRHAPINTINYGNMYITFNPSLVNAGATITRYDEFFAYTGITNTAQSIGA